MSTKGERIFEMVSDIALAEDWTTTEVLAGLTHALMIGAHVSGCTLNQVLQVISVHWNAVGEAWMPCSGGEDAN